MSINSISNRTITGVRKNKKDYEFKELKAKQNGHVRTINTRQKLQLEYFQSLRYNPHSAFLHDPRTTRIQKLAILSTNPYIYNSQRLTREIGTSSTDWTDERCFEYELHKYLNENNRRIKAKVIDMSDPINRANFEKIKEAKSRIISNSDFRAKYRMNEYDFRRYCNSGLLQRFQLPNRQTGKMVNLGIIDPTTETNQAGIERYLRITPLRGEIYRKVNDENNSLRSINKTPIYLNSRELAELGFGSQKHTIELIEKGYYKGAVKTAKNAKGQTVKLAYVNVNNLGTRLRLEKERNKYSPTSQDIANAYGIDLFKIEDAMLNGEIDFIKEQVFNTDSNYARINLTNPKNVATIDRLLFEKNIEEQEKETRKSMNNLRAKLCWYYSPNTSLAAKQAYASDKNIKPLKAQEKKLISMLEDITITPEKRKELEEQLEEIQAKIKVEYRIIAARMWDIAGTEEYTQACKKARETIENIKANGLSEIKDEKLIQICLEYLPNLAQ